MTRPAPSPTEPNTKGNPRLSARFSEWLMGWPDGWVTKVPGISRNDALRVIGNGVVPAQAAAALRWLLSISQCTALAYWSLIATQLDSAATHAEERTEGEKP